MGMNVETTLMKLDGNAYVSPEYPRGGTEFTVARTWAPDRQVPTWLRDR
jgi:hypothetical protein